MTPDPAVWEQRGRSWYKIGLRSSLSNPYKIATCEHCGESALMQRKGRFCSRSCANAYKHRQGKLGGSGPRNPNWKGALVSYSGAHRRILRTRGKAARHPCVDCGAPALHWSYDGKDPEELTATSRRGQEVRYSGKPEHYEPRCVTCHNHHDIQYQHGERHHWAKLTDAQVGAIRAAGLLDENGERVSRQQVADAYGVSVSLIGGILRGSLARAATGDGNIS
jgi:hypothetical protein